MQKYAWMCILIQEAMPGSKGCKDEKKQCQHCARASPDMVGEYTASTTVLGAALRDEMLCRPYICAPRSCCTLLRPNCACRSISSILLSAQCCRETVTGTATSKTCAPPVSWVPVLMCKELERAFTKIACGQKVMHGTPCTHMAPAPTVLGPQSVPPAFIPGMQGGSQSCPVTVSVA